MSLPSYELIDSEAGWIACLKVLQQQPRLAVDLEANSLYVYRERVCLLQISVPGHDYIIDPLAGFDLSDLGPLFADPAIEKVFHSCEYDLMLLKRNYGWNVVHLFDTMWAGRILGYTNMGLAWFLRSLYGVELSKKHQKANWGRRPLSEEELMYAQCDTHYLLQLRDDLAQRLEEGGHTTEAREIFANTCHVDVPDREFSPDGFWTLPGARLLPGRAQAILRELYVFREEEAQRRDVPPFKVLHNETLIALAQLAPSSLDELGNVKNLSHKHIQHMGIKLLRIIARGKSAPTPIARKRPRAHTYEASTRYNRLIEWRKKTAQERGVESDVIISRDAIWKIAELNPKSVKDLESIRSLGAHRRKLYGDEIVQELQENLREE